jgi:PleD family two-component response regulator
LFLGENRRTALSRDQSYVGSVPEHLRTSVEGPQGSEIVADNKTLLKAVRMPEEYEGAPSTSPPAHTAPHVMFNIPDKSRKDEPRRDVSDHLRVLVAEDDPINSKIIKKRLEKAHHEVYHTVNGEECATTYGERPEFFDVVLMDMQASLLLSSHIIKTNF